MSYQNTPRYLNNTIRLGSPKFKYTALGGIAMVRPGVGSYASHSFGIAGNRLTSPTHPVTWYNIKTNQPAVTINMLSDSGADYSTFELDFAPRLGINITQGQKVVVSGYRWTS